jgi:hypothetical protein
VSGFDLGVRDLAAFPGQTVGREVPLVDEVQIGAADRARRERLQPRPIMQAVRQFHHHIGLPSAFRLFEHLLIAPADGTPG